MKPISYIKDLLECFRLRCENAWLKNIVRREYGEAKFKEIEAEVERETRKKISSKEKKKINE